MQHSLRTRLAPRRMLRWALLVPLMLAAGPVPAGGLPDSADAAAPTCDGGRLMATATGQRLASAEAATHRSSARGPTGHEGVDRAHPLGWSFAALLLGLAVGCRVTRDAAEVA